MNQPQGFELDADRQRHRRRPDRGALQPGHSVRVLPHAAGRLHGHRLPRRLGLRGRDAPRPPRPLPPGRHADPARAWRRSRRRSSSSSATPPPARSPRTSRPSSRRWSACTRPGADQTEYIGGICTDDEVKYAIGIPGLDSLLVGFSTDTVVTGLDQIPDDEEPPAKTLLHLSFDAMVGIGTGAVRARASGSRSALVAADRRDGPRGQVVPARGRRSPGSPRSSRCGAAGSSPRSAASPGSSTATCGPRTRSPAPRACGGSSASRSRSTPRSASPRSWCCGRWRGAGARTRSDERRCPTAPSAGEGGLEMSKADAVAAILLAGATLYAVFGGADFGAGHLGAARRARRRTPIGCAPGSSTRSRRSGRRTTSG